MARPLSREARAKAVEAAQALLAEGGLDACTLEAVARRSGVAKTTLYRHWGSANVLLGHAIDTQIERIPTPNTGSLVGDLLEIMTLAREKLAQPETQNLMLEVMSRATSDPELAAVKTSLVHERTRPLRELTQRAIDRGEIPPIDLELATDLIEGPMLARSLRTNAPVAAEELPHLAAAAARALGCQAD